MPRIREAPPLEPAHYEKLDRLVRTLVDRFRALQEEHRELREKLDEREAKIRALEERLLGLQTSRQDVAKRIDDLLAQVDALDEQLSAGRAG